MMNLGDFTTTDTIYVPFTTYGSFGQSITLSGFVDTDIKIYKDGITTERNNESGYTRLDTDGTDFSGATGLHGFSIDLSDNTEAGFYADGSQYWITVDTVAVDGETVLVAFYFSIGRMLKPTTAGRTLDCTAGGNAGIDWNNVETPGATVPLSATTVGTVSAVTLLSANAIAVGAFAADSITASAYAVGAIAADAFVAGAIDAAAIGTNAIDADALAPNCIGATEIAIGAIEADAFAAGAINAAAIASDAIGANEFSLAAAQKVRDAVTGGAWALNTTTLGNIGIDWANVQNNTNATPLSSTTVGVTSLVTLVDTSGLTANSIAPDAIGASELAASAVTEIRDAVTGGAYALDTDANGRVRIVDGIGAGELNTASGNVSLASGSIVAATFGAGAIDATAIATDAIGSAELAASAVTEIRDAVNGGAYSLDTDANGRIRIVDGIAAGELNTSAGTVSLTAGAIVAATFGAGAINSAAIATDAIGAAEFATDAVNEIRAAVTGGAYSIDTDANGRTRIVDGVGVGELNTAAGTVLITNGTITSSSFAAGAIDAAAIATDAIGTAELAASAVTAIRDGVTGGAWALDTDLNGRIRIVDGTGAGEINTSSGTVSLTAGSIVAATFTAGAIDAASTSADFVAEIQSGLATAANVTSAHSTTDALLATAQADLDTITGADGVTLATLQALYAPNVVIPPSVAQFNARTLVAASYFDPTTDAVANVTLVATTTTNTDMVGTDSAALAATALTDVTWTDARAASLDTISTLALTTDVTTAHATTDALLAALQADLPTRITKNVAIPNYPFLMVLTSDHASAATGKSITAERRLDSGVFAAAANSATELSDGLYTIDLAASDLNGDTVVLKFTATACDARIITIVTQPT